MKKADLHNLVHECLQEVLSERYDEFQRVDKGAKKVASKDKAEEDVYGAGFAAGEKAAKEKYKKLAEAYKALKEASKDDDLENDDLENTTSNDDAYSKAFDAMEDDKLDEARFKKGTDIGKPGKGFEKVAKAAEKQYGSKEAGQKVAGSILKKVLNKESRFEAKSKLEKVIQQAWAEKDLNKAKQIVIDLIEPSRIKSKDTIISTLKSITNKPKLDQYLANSLLKFEKMGLSETIDEEDSLNENFFLKFRDLRAGGTYTATTDFGIFKKGDTVHVDDTYNAGSEVMVDLANDNGDSDSIKGDLEDEVEVFN